MSDVDEAAKLVGAKKLATSRELVGAANGQRMLSASGGIVSGDGVLLDVCSEGKFFAKSRNGQLATAHGSCRHLAARNRIRVIAAAAAWCQHRARENNSVFVVSKSFNRCLLACLLACAFKQ